MNDRPDLPPADADLVQQLSAIADHAVRQSRAAQPPLRDAAVPERSRRLVAAGALVAVVALVAGVAAVAMRDDGGRRVVAGPSTTDPAAAPGEVEYGGNITVLESREHGPQLCGAVAESYPPQCGGPDVVGWDWTAVDGEESANGTTWGTFYVVGTWAGGRLTLTRPPTAPVPTPRLPETDFTTPCEDLRDGSGGATDRLGDLPPGLDADPEYAGSWWDDANGVMNYGFTANVDEHRADIETQSTDPVCVVAMSTSQADLLAAQETLSSVSSRPVGIEMYGSGITLDRDEAGAPRFVLSVEVIVADPATTAWVESFIGAVPYRLGALLNPVEPLGTTPTTGTAPTATTAATPVEITNAEQALAAWEAAGITDYSFTFTPSCFCSLVETTIAVQAGIGKSSNPEQTPEFALTVEQLIAEVARAEVEATGEVRINWSELGVPVEVSIDWLENGIDDEMAWTVMNFTEPEPVVGPDLAALDAAEAQWSAAGVAEYSYRITNTMCECAPLDAVVTVRGGEVVSVDGEYPTGFVTPTVEEWFDKIRGSGEVSVTYGDRGAPTRIVFNESQAPVDGAIGYILTYTFNA